MGDMRQVHLPGTSVSRVCIRICQGDTAARMEGNWRIGQFSARVGVAAGTLRAWGRRYGLLRPARTAAGYRLYTPEDEQRVRAMQAQMALGVAPAEAAVLAVRQVGDVATPPEESRRALLAAVAAYDAEGI